MSREEEYLIETFGKKNAFRVPEGYFDDFANRLMATLPDAAADVSKATEAANARVVRMPWHRRYARVAVAASLAAVVAGVGGHFAMSKSDGSSAGNQVAASHYDSSLDQMADYAMIDVGDIYAYVSDY